MPAQAQMRVEDLNVDAPDVHAYPKRATRLQPLQRPYARQSCAAHELCWPRREDCVAVFFFHDAIGGGSDAPCRVRARWLPPDRRRPCGLGERQAPAGRRYRAAVRRARARCAPANTRRRGQHSDERSKSQCVAHHHRSRSKRAAQVRRTSNAGDPGSFKGAAFAASIQPTALPDEVGDDIESDAGAHVRKDIGSDASHPLRVGLHHAQVRAHERRKIDLVDDQQIRARDARPALARDFSPCATSMT